MKAIKYITKAVAGRLRKKFERKIPVYIPVLQSDLLKDRVALITGGTSGIGFAIAKAFLSAGAYVIITGRSSERVRRCCIDLESHGSADRILGIEMDNADVNRFQERLDLILGLVEGRTIDILVNNAGVNQGGSYGNTTNDDFDAVINTNLKGAYFLSQLVSRYMKDNNIQGNILNICSSSSLRPANSPYILSKWGIRGMTIGLGKLLIPHGIVVNGLAPGPTATPMLIKDDSLGLELSHNPSGRYATADEVANMAVILTSSLGRLIVGDIVYMTGGAGVLTVDDVSCSY
jgi:NAD(P)-dependent dehydrogenase (short-subunit alcohol dehydrogenase family)